MLMHVDKARQNQATPCINNIIEAVRYRRGIVRAYSRNIGTINYRKAAWVNITIRINCYYITVADQGTCHRNILPARIILVVQ